MIKITKEDFSIDKMVKEARRDDVGAIVTFLGTVRDDGIQSMQIEAFSEPALAELQAIREEAIDRYSLKSVQVVHRIGSLPVGESIVAIVCSAGHREEAFAGCRYILEELKRRAPIWKKEIGENDGRWVGRT